MELTLWHKTIFKEIYQIYKYLHKYILPHKSNIVQFSTSMVLNEWDMLGHMCEFKSELPCFVLFIVFNNTN